MGQVACTQNGCVSHSNDEHGVCVCHCFDEDQHVKERVMRRIVSVKWFWSYQHKAALHEALCDFPTEILQLIQSITTDATDQYHIPALRDCHEKYYASNAHLVSKTLCKSWYEANAWMLSPFSIALVDASNTEKQQLLHSFNNDNLPALQRIHSYSDEHLLAEKCRTVYIDNNRMSVGVRSIGVQQVHADLADMYLIPINQDELRSYCVIAKIERISVEIAKKTGRHQNIILVQTGNGAQCMRKAQSVRQIVLDKYNAPYLHVDFQHGQSIQRLFAFCIKYYWFTHSRLHHDSE